MTAAAGVVVGVDGGNSKTDVVLADLDGTVLARLTGTGTRPHRTGVVATCRQVVDLVDDARREAGVGDGPLAAASFHWANLDTPATEQAAADAVAACGVALRTVVRNDTFAVLRAGAPDGWGVAVVSGAGVNACAVAPDGRTARFLALGEISGDWGGGGGIATAAVGAAVRAGDGRGPATVLRDLLPPVLGEASVEDVAVAVVDGRLRYGDLLALAPVVAAAAEAGDPVSVGLLHRQADEIVTMVAALLRRLDLLGDDVPVVLGGGTLQHGPALLHRRIDAGLATAAPRARTLVLDTRPVAGPVLEALELAGRTSPAVVAAVRAALTSRAPATP